MSKDQILDYLEDLENTGGFRSGPYFASDSEAQLTAAWLRSEGIRCFVSNSNTQTMLPLAFSTIKLFIHGEDWEEAMAILDQHQEPEQIETLSNGHSTADEYDEKKYSLSRQIRRFGLGWVLLILFMIIFIMRGCML
jgi:hypothetical protein